MGEQMTDEEAFTLRAKEMCDAWQAVVDKREATIERLRVALAALVETFRARPDMLALCGFKEHAEIKAACEALNRAGGMAAANTPPAPPR